MATLFVGTAWVSAAELLRNDEFFVRRWDIEDGLPSTRVNAVTTTPDGYLWFGTQAGLVRFDGERFVVFDGGNTPALSDSLVSSLLTDEAGTLWIGLVDGAVLRREGGDLVKVIPSTLVGAKSITQMARDQEAGLWLATKGAGLVRVNPTANNPVADLQDLPFKFIQAVLCCEGGSVWTVAEGTLLHLEEGVWKPVEEVSSLSLPVQAIAPGWGADLWVATAANPRGGGSGARCFKWEKGQLTEISEVYPWPQESAESRTSVLLEDKTGRLWCGTTGYGVFWRDLDGRWQPLFSSRPLSNLDILCLYEDEDGAIWIGTRRAGLIQVLPRMVKGVALPEDAQQFEVTTVCAARDGSIWAGTDGAGLFRWKDGQVKNYGHEQGLANLQINTLLEDHQTNLWAGTSKGLFCQSGEYFTSIQDPYPLRGMITTLFESSQGALWVGCSDSVVCLHEDGAQVFDESSGIPSGTFRAFAEDRQGNLWAGVRGAGLFRFEGERFQRVPVANGEWMETSLRGLLFDEAGGLWISGNGSALFYYKDGELRRWTWQDQGLPSNHHFGLLEDLNGHLWISSESGIFGASKRTLIQHQSGKKPPLATWRLMPRDGLPQKVCTGGGQPTAMRSSDGRLWFPDGPNVATFDPASVLRSMRIRRPLVEEVIADEIPVKPGSEGEVVIPSSVRRIEIHYSAPNLIAPDRMRYRTRLQGLEDEWIDVGPQRVAYYNRLPPGHYRFDVMASGPDEQWTQADTTLSVTIVPAFYERRSVQVLGASAMLAVIMGTLWWVGRMSMHRRLEQNRIRDSMDKERQRIARDIHDDLGSRLTEMVLLSANLGVEGARTPEGEEIIREITFCAKDLTLAMDEVIWAVDAKNDSIEGLITYLSNFARQHLALGGVRYRLDAPDELPARTLSAEVRHNLFLAGKEALTNAVRHARAAEVWLRVQLESDNLRIIVEDNGEGFDPKVPHESRHGLKNIAKRLEDLGGACRVESAPGSGTRIILAVNLAAATRSTGNRKSVFVGEG